MNRSTADCGTKPISSGRFPTGLLAMLAKSLLMCVLALLPSVTSAFGLKTHLWIGQQLLDDIQASCRATIKGVPAAVNADV